MSTGSVNPFTPSQPTQVLNAGTVSSAATFIPGDVLLLYNDGTVPVFVAIGTGSQSIQAIVPVGTVVGSFPVPPQSEHLIGTPSVPGNQEGQITQLAAITAQGTVSLFITPGLGTEY